ncbi:hypothetical protein HDV01_001581 [Terramyces sp. JEL0728]|nr:hypothetical protein HDV01_001581 [Terramyces sp. JEL0728]
MNGPISLPDEEQQQPVNKYDTTIKIPIQFLAPLCYALGGISGTLILIFETSNDYARFHAYQSLLLFVPLLIVIIIIGLISTILSDILLFGYVCSSLFLAYQAYLNSDALFRFKVPVLGDYASKWTDSE